MMDLVLLYILIGGILMFYWERDNDGLIALQPFEMLGWPFFLVLYGIRGR